MSTPLLSSSSLSSSISQLLLVGGRSKRSTSTSSCCSISDQESLVAEQHKQQQQHSPLHPNIVRELAVQALAVSVPAWTELGQGRGGERGAIGDPNVAACAPERLSVAVERITALLFIRLVAVAAPPGTYQDLSTTTICRALLMQQQDNIPDTLTESAVKQLRRYVRSILKRYHDDLPFHSFKHAYHVVISANKLLDLMLSSQHSSPSAPSSSSSSPPPRKQSLQPPTFGLRKDPLALFALFFAALIHDVHHSGVTNRQLVQEAGPDSILYNDNSIQEQRSLTLAFDELLQPQKYPQFYALLFPTETDYRRFRILVIDAVLSTDIASPEQAQISKSKWKEAFGSTFHSSGYTGGDPLGDSNHHPCHGGGRGRRSRRGSLASDISKPRIVNPNQQQQQQQHRNLTRRGSNLSTNSTMSDVTIDSYTRLKQQQGEQQQQQYYYNNYEDDPSSPYTTSSNNGKNGGRVVVMNAATMSRRLSNQSVDSMYSDFGTDSVYNQQRANAQRTARPQRRRASNQSVDSMYSDFGADSFKQYQKKNQNNNCNNTKSGGRDDAATEETMIIVDINKNNNGTNTAPIRGLGRRQSLSRRNLMRRSSTTTYQTKDSEAYQSIVCDSIGLAQKHKKMNTAGERRMMAHSNSLAAAEREDNGSLDSDQDSNGKARPGYQYEYGEYDDDDDSDSSMSLTPPSSEDEFDGVVITGESQCRVWRCKEVSFLQHRANLPCSTHLFESFRYVRRYFIKHHSC